jgi:nicotinamidase/pyrazinamidase
MKKLNGEKTALLIVDMLNDFVRKDGALVVPHALDLIPNQKKLLEKARQTKVKVIYLADHHLPNDREFEKWPPHAIAGTPGSDVIQELRPREGEQVIPKRRYSGFFGTDLDLILRESGVESIILAGVLTDICVMYTSADASARNYAVVVVTDATGSTSDENHRFALSHMRDVHGALLASTRQVVSLVA